MKTILVTGATGFVGKTLLKKLSNSDYSLFGTRHGTKPVEHLDNLITWVPYELGDANSISTDVLKETDVIIHLAGLAHQKKKTTPFDFFKINTEGTKRLAYAAATVGVKHFIFLSTIKVNGEVNRVTKNGVVIPYSETDTPEPVGPYAESKRGAEQFLQKACEESSMTYTIIRPPIIYGIGVKANIYKLIDIVARGIPLPLSMASNKRSMLYVENLVNILLRVIEDKHAYNQLYLVKDEEISTHKLIKAIASALEKKSSLFPCPMPLLKLVCYVLGRSDEYQKLTSSLLIDDSKIRADLDWKSPMAFDVGLRKTVDWYLETKGA